MAIQITSGQLIGLSSYSLTKPNDCHPAAHNTQKCQNFQTINFHTSIYWHCIFMATEVISQTTDIVAHLLHVLHFILKQMQYNTIQHLLMDLFL